MDKNSFMENDISFGYQWNDCSLIIVNFELRGNKSSRISFSSHLKNFIVHDGFHDQQSLFSQTLLKSLLVMVRWFFTTHFCSKCYGSKLK